MEQNAQVGLGNVLARKLGIILSVLVFLLPVFFVPVSGISLYVAKITLLATGLVAVFAVFLSSVLSSGTVEMPKAKYLLPITLFALVALVSSALSGSITSSIVGTVFDLGTSGSLLMLVFLLFMVVVSVRSLGLVSKIISAFLYAAVVMAVYALVGAFGASLLPTALTSKLPFFLTGGAVDTAIIFGAAVIMALCAINMSEVSKKWGYTLFALIAFSLLFIGAINFLPVVVILGVISLVFFVYILSWSVGARNNITENSQTEETSTNAPINNRKISLSSLIVLVASVILILGGSSISGFLSKALKTQTTEIRPNFEATMNLTLSAWQKNFALGVGPNRFAEFWSANKPAEINQTQFWNANFYSGSGFIPTIAITTGLLGLLSLLAFLAMYLLTGVKAIFAQANAGRSRYLATSSFLVSLYLWVILFLYSPGLIVLALAFIFTGLFTVTLIPQGIIGLWKVNIFSNPKTNFLSVLSIVILLIVSVAGGYFVWERTVASVIFERGVLAYQEKGDIGMARSSIAKSINIAQSDIYWRSLAEISMADLGRVLGGITGPEQMTDTIRTEAQRLITDSVESAKKAVAVNDDNFQNWFALARVYEVLASNGVAGASDSARDAYNGAALRSPRNPSVPLSLARLEALSGNLATAKEQIVKSLEIKNNYTDAYYTLAQIQVAEGDVVSAIKSVEAATIVDPGNSGLYFQLGLLKYNQRDWRGAASAFEMAVKIIPDYANAKYFLGLSYYNVGQKAEALKQFEEINQTNPDNAEVTAIISNLKAGKDPFTGAKPPADDSPEDRTEPPIEES